MNTDVLMKALLKPQKTLFICVHLWLKKNFRTLSWEGGTKMETAREKNLTISNLQSNDWRSWLNSGFKRLFDVFVSVLGLILLSPVFGLLSFLIKRESPGPVLYRGPRAGQGGRPFGILKFRTMRECPESYDGPRVTAKDDERITPLGKWLRDTKLNELPQRTV